jgi:protein-S-isoprenylcysteine O-methyltransferase Ste14
MKKNWRVVLAAAIIGAAIGYRLTLHPIATPSNGRHLYVSIALWIAFALYWSFASRNSARTASGESTGSTVLHQLLLLAALFSLFWQIPGLNGWFLPRDWTATIAIGAVIQATFLALAVWARRHLGRNWAAEVRIGEGHELVRTGPYRWLRHPIYTAMLGMFVGTAIASSQYHALAGVGLLFVAYIRKTRLEEDILTRTFPADYEAYRRHTWRLVPPVF